MHDENDKHDDAHADAPAGVYDGATYDQAAYDQTTYTDDESTGTVDAAPTEE